MTKIFSYLQQKHGLSRREFTQMIQEKAVWINGTCVESFNAVAKSNDLLEIKKWGKTLLSEKMSEIKKKKSMIVLFNKPKWFTVSKEDKHNRTIYEFFPASWKNDFYYIGRLDKDSHGLLLLTNEPALVDQYEKPENNIHKIYEVEIDKPFKSQHAQKAKKGIHVDETGKLVDQNSAPTHEDSRVELLKVLAVRYQHINQKHFLTITLNEWKKRHLRRLCKALWYRVKDLKRVKVWKYQLGTIKPGKYMLQPLK